MKSGTDQSNAVESSQTNNTYRRILEAEQRSIRAEKVRVLITRRKEGSCLTDGEKGWEGRGKILRDDLRETVVIQGETEEEELVRGLGCCWVQLWKFEI